ncbi:MAG: HPr family phosphocarrier protein [Clostridiales bacterium]|nr:HPr family phosphocarrier protein [Clostridiales bacterium]
MIKQPIAFPGGKPLTRASAAQLVQITSRFECGVMIEHCQKLVNAKSMLGLLSLSVDNQSDMVLLADGPDEETAAAAVMEWLSA